MSEEMVLLREYAATWSQPAFARLVDRYIDLVYTAARRQVAGDAHLAEDVTQAVFIVLAQKAKSVPVDRPLSAWLLKVTRYCAANARRHRQRQESHERRAAEMARANERITSDATADADWEALAPMLDQGLSKLGEADRNALLLRFFEHKSLRQVGEALGISEEAAQKRVTRAVEKLRDFFRRRGATVGAGALPALLTSESINAAPIGLSGTVAAASTTTAATATGSSTAAAAAAKGAMVAMTMHKTVVLTAAGLVLLLGIGAGTVAIRAVTGSGTRARQVNVAVLPTAAPGGGGVTFADGSTAAILGIGEVPAPTTAQWVKSLISGGPTPNAAQRPAQWWGPDGSPLPAPALPRGMSQISAGDSPGRRQVYFVFALRGPAATNSGLTIRMNNAGSGASSSHMNGQESIEDVVYSLPENATVCDVRLAISKGPWSEEASMTLPNTTQPTTRTSGPAMFSNLREENGNCVLDIRIPPNRTGEDRDTRLIVSQKNGKQAYTQQWRGYPNGRGVVTLSCRLNEVAKIAWTSRPYEWQTISNVSLKPVTATTQPATRIAVSGR